MMVRSAEFDGGGGDSEGSAEQSSEDSGADRYGDSHVADHDIGEAAEESGEIASAVAETKQSLMASLKRVAEDQEQREGLAKAEKVYGKAVKSIDRTLDFIEVLEVVSVAAEAYQQGQDPSAAARDFIESRVREDRGASPYLDKIFNDVLMQPRREYY